jgi:hypothetical protein
MRKKINDSYGKSITLAILAILLFAGVAKAKIGTVEMLMLFWGGETATIYATDQDGAYLTDEDGAYITVR